jgi:thioredoxin-related protein
MKLFIAFILLALPISGNPILKTPKTAKEKHELILLNFSIRLVYSCILFRRDYLENEAFGQMAADHLVLVNADFPRKKKNTGSPDVVARNKALAEIYNKEGSFPLTLLLDADGR